MSENFQPFIEFHSWVDTHQVVGTDGLGNDAKYIPVDTLERYWQRNRISRVLNSCIMPINVSIDDIVTRYLRIFSILVYISTAHSVRLNYIRRFMEEAIDDILLPFKAKPDALPNAPDGVQTFGQFQENQWLFSPVVLGPNRSHSRELLARCVLPFTVEKVLSGRAGESTMVKKCRFHPSCGLTINAIVLKEFDSSEIELSFQNEVDSYINLENKVPPTVYEQQFLKYYGSFKKAEKAFIMLEYADQGSLLDFFKRNELPLEQQELYDLWSSISNLFIGLEYIHSLEQNPRNSDFGTIRCVHQDLKPANIFVFRHGESDSYRYQLKIGDFGMSSMALVKIRNKSIKSPDNMSTKMYGAPELTQHYPDLEEIDYGTSWESDIWSLGCVLFEVLVWTICGSRGLSEFFRTRQRETESVPRHQPQGYSGCFHNGKVRIQAVDKMMDLIMKRRRIFDNLSGAIGKLILEDMLIPSAGRRLEAGTLLPRFEKILEAEGQSPGRLDQPLTRAAQGESRLSGYTAMEDRADRGFQLKDQPTWPAGQRVCDCGSRHLGSSEPRASGSHTESRRSYRGANESRSSSQTFEAHEGSRSATSMKPSDRHQARKRLSVTDDPPYVSHSPMNTGLGAIFAMKDMEHEGIHTSERNHRPAGEPFRFNDRFLDGGFSTSQLDMASRSNPRRPEPYAVVTIPKVLQWIDRKKRGCAPEALPDNERAMREINGREQIFVVDDSDTMRKNHWHQVVETLQALGYLVKHADPDGVELFLTSRPTKPKRSGGKEITSLVRSLEEHARTRPEGPCNMESSLGPVLEHVKSGLMKGSWFRQQTNCRGVSVYILTDAIWEGGPDIRCGVEQPIKDLRRTMEALGKTRTTVALQFIQFGDDALGEERLRYLDDNLGKELDFDIVDHRHHQRDGVWHMLVGSISRDIDKDNNVGSRAAIV